MNLQVKLTELFPSIVASSKTLAVISSGLRGNHGDALHLVKTTITIKTMCVCVCVKLLIYFAFACVR